MSESDGSKKRANGRKHGKSKVPDVNKTYERSVITEPFLGEKSRRKSNRKPFVKDWQTEKKQAKRERSSGVATEKIETKKKIL